VCDVDQIIKTTTFAILYELAIMITALITEFSINMQCAKQRQMHCTYMYLATAYLTKHKS